MTPESVLLVLGAGFVVFGAAMLSWPAGFLAAGVLALLAVVDMRGGE